MDSTIEGLDGFTFQQADRLAPLYLLLNEYIAEPVTEPLASFRRAGDV